MQTMAKGAAIIICFTTALIIGVVSSFSLLALVVYFVPAEYLTAVADTVAGLIS